MKVARKVKEEKAKPLPRKLLKPKTSKVAGLASKADVPIKNEGSSKPDLLSKTPRNKLKRKSSLALNGDGTSKEGHSPAKVKKLLPAKAQQKRQKSSAKTEQKPQKSSAKTEQKPQKSTAKTQQKPQKSTAKTQQKPLKSTAKTQQKPLKSAAKGKSGASQVNKAAKKNSAQVADVTTDPRLQNLNNATDAVLKLASKSQAGQFKKQLFASDAQPILLQVDSFRVARTSPRTLRFNLPHSVHNDNADICLILGDPIKGRKRDTEQEVIVENYKELLETKGVKNIKEVIPFNYFRAQYGPYEMKRRFANSYDVVLCDSRFIGHATHFLGNEFFTRKCLTPVRLIKGNSKEFVTDFKSAIDFALHKTWMRIHPNGNSFNVTIGNTKQTKEEIAANILAVFKGLTSSFPGGLNNIRLGLLRCHKTVAVPAFVSTKSPAEVPVPFIQPLHDKRGEPAEGELSTLPGRQLRVYPSGHIDIVDKRTEEDEEYDKIMGNFPKRKRRRNNAAEEDGNSIETKHYNNRDRKATLFEKKKPRFAGRKTSGQRRPPSKAPTLGNKFSTRKKPTFGKKRTLGKNQAQGKKRPKQEKS